MITTERLEDRPLLRGEGAYASDIRLDGQLALAVVRSNVAHGVLQAIDVSAALGAPGVHAVLTGADLGDVRRIPIRRAGRPGMERCLQPVLATDRVRYVGEPVAVVVADDRYLAEDAAELVEVTVDPLDPVVDATAAAALQPLHDGVDGNRLYALRGTSGDVDGAHRQAAVVVREELRSGRQTGLPIETRSVLARWRDDGTLDLWGPTKFVHFTRQTIAGMLAVDPDDVVVHRIDVGGMFGTRGEVYPEDFLVPWAARVVGAPVQWIEDRREHLLSINHSRETVHSIELSVAADGTFLGLRDHVVLDAGAYSRPIGGRLGELVLETVPGPYRWQSIDVGCTAMLTNKTPVGTMRGPSGLESNFARERMIDIAARRLGIDPVEIRRRNLIPGSAMPFVRRLDGDIEPSTYDTGDYPALLQEVLERIGYDELERDVAIRRERGEAVGIGTGLFLEASGFGVTESASLRLDGDGRFVIGTSASEIGQGLASTLAAVAADALGVDPSLITVELGSTDAHGGGTGTFGSRTTIFVGSAVQRACIELLDRLRGELAIRRSVAPESIGVCDEGLVVGGEVCAWSHLGRHDVVGVHDADAPTVGFGAHVAVVAVDRGTGHVTVEQLAVAYDCGRAVRRESVASQLIGATVGAVGGTLLEELRYDDTGQPLSTTFMDYLVPTCGDVPRVEAVVLESGRVPGNPLGVKGAGEAGVQGVAAAVANAAAHAVCTTNGLRSIPIRPEAVLDAWGIPAATPASSAADTTTPRRPALVVAALGVVALATWIARRRLRRRDR